MSVLELVEHQIEMLVEPQPSGAAGGGLLAAVPVPIDGRGLDVNVVS